MPHIIRNNNCVEITDEEYISLMEESGYVGIVKKEDGGFYCDGKKVGAFVKEDLMALKQFIDETEEVDEYAQLFKNVKILGRGDFSVSVDTDNLVIIAKPR